MTIAVARRYAFFGSVGVGLVATLLAVALVTALISSPEQVVLSLSDPDLGSLVRVILKQLATAVRAVARLF